MSNAIRFVVSDIDGTLVRNDKTIGDATVAAAHRLRDAGVPMSLISARPPSGMQWIVEKLGLTAPYGAFNGGTIVGADGRIISADHLSPDMVARALELIDKPGITPWLFADGIWYARETTNEYVPRERKAANVEPVLREDFTTLTARVDKIVGVSDDHDLLERLEGEMVKALGDHATVVRSQVYYLDITAPTGNKGDGITALAKAMDVPLTHVAAFGDQFNDVAMFQRAGLSVAMAQGPQGVRDAADHVSTSNDEDGVANAIDRFVLPTLKG